MSITATKIDAPSERERAVNEAIHNVEMEDLHITSATRDDAAEYISGAMDIDEVLARVGDRHAAGRAAAFPPRG